MNNIKLNLTVTILCFLSLVSPFTYAGNPCQIAPNGGIGGTGYMPEDGGIGGTGYAPIDGIGGTGNQIDNGIGGTGDKLAVIGVVTGFASICVNGIEVHYDDTTAININGEATNSGQLAVGQVVSVSAEKSPKGWNAVKIQSSDAVSGPVTKFTAPNRAEIAGQTVLLPKEKIGPNIDKFAIGQHVRVQGIRMNTGEIFATSATRSTRKDVTITGKVIKDANGNMSIGSVKLGNLTPKFTENNQQVSVSGHLNGNTLQVTAARPALQIDASASYLSIQSDVASVQNGQLQLTNGAKIQTNRTVKSGNLLQINAYKDKNGLWQSLTISEQTHADLMKRAGIREDNSGKTNKKSDGNDDDNREDDREDNKSNSGSSDDDDSGSKNSGSSNSGSSNSSSSKSGSNSNRLSNDSDSKHRGSSSNENLKIDKVEIDKVDKVEKAEKVEKLDKVEKVERVDRSRSSDRIRSDDRGRSGRGRD